MNLEYLSGCQAVSEAVRLAKVDVVAAYPITPQTSIVEGIAKNISSGRMISQMIHVESEHSAMTACVGAACVGARTFTATSGQGLAYMQEPVFWAAGLRLPIVMAITNRSLLGPNTIFCDHQDTMSHRDSGWIQIYVENCQEVMDTILISYLVAENPKILLPIMVCLDGFFLSHLYEPVEIPDQELVDSFLLKSPPTQAILDPNEPKLLNVLAPPEYYTEFEYDKNFSMVDAEKVLSEAFNTYNEKFLRNYSNLECYEIEDAEIILISMGTAAGTVRSVVKELRRKNIPVGLIKVKTFRPFPYEQLRSLLNKAQAIGVINRSISFGSGGTLSLEVLRSIQTSVNKPLLFDFIAGLGGRDISYITIKKTIDYIQNSLSSGKRFTGPIWIDLNEDIIKAWGMEV